MKRIRISYPVSSKAPLYIGTPPVSFQPIKSIQRGDSANTTLISLSSHVGTHLDVPRHFCRGGKSVRDFFQDSTEIAPVYCLNIAKGPQEAVRITDLEPHLESVPDAAGLFLRTGMFALRAPNPDGYVSLHPWIHPEVPDYLRSVCPLLILFGTDTISISNPRYREEGRECHKSFLCGERPILLGEDLDLSNPGLLGGPFQVEIFPWIIDNLDGVPICAFAELPVPATGKDGGERKYS